MKRTFTKTSLSASRMRPCACGSAFAATASDKSLAATEIHIAFWLWKKKKGNQLLRCPFTGACRTPTSKNIPIEKEKSCVFFFLVFPIALKDMTQLNYFLSFPSKTAPPNAPAKQSQNRNRSSRIHLILNQPHGTKLCRAADGPHTIDYNSI